MFAHTYMYADIGEAQNVWPYRAHLIFDCFSCLFLAIQLSFVFLCQNNTSQCVDTYFWVLVSFVCTYMCSCVCTPTLAYRLFSEYFLFTYCSNDLFFLFICLEIWRWHTTYTNYPLPLFSLNATTFYCYRYMLLSAFICWSSFVQRNTRDFVLPLFQ